MLTSPSYSTPRLAPMKAPKILAVASAVDLDFRYGCTPAWWQLWKGLYEVGVDLIVTPYRGRPSSRPWWRTAPNPTYVEGESFAAARSGHRAAEGRPLPPAVRGAPRGLRASTATTREAIWRWVTPRWRRHLEQVLERERDVDAVIVFTVPMAHFRGIPTYLRERFGVPVVFYDGDVPMSLPEFGGMDTGFNYYHGADPSEYDLVVSNSEGGLRACSSSARGARRRSSGAPTPSSSRPRQVEKQHDVFFYGYGDKFRRDWMAGDGRRAEPGRARARLRARRPRLPGRHGPRLARRRRPVQRVRARDLGVRGSTSTSRAGRTRAFRPPRRAGRSSSPRRAPRSSPTRYEGIERWFEPGQELLVVNDADEALSAYRDLLADPAQAEAMGAPRPRARPRRAHLRPPGDGSFWLSPALAVPAAAGG